MFRIELPDQLGGARIYVRLVLEYAPFPPFIAMPIRLGPPCQAVMPTDLDLATGPDFPSGGLLVVLER